MPKSVQNIPLHEASASDSPIDCPPSHLFLQSLLILSLGTLHFQGQFATCLQDPSPGVDGNLCSWIPHSEDDARSVNRYCISRSCNLAAGIKVHRFQKSGGELPRR